MPAAAKAAEWLAAVREVVAVERARAPATLAAMWAGYRQLAMGPRDFFAFDLHRRPLATWADYIKYRPTQVRLMLWLNLQRDRFIARDKVRASARARDRGLAIAPILALVGRTEDPCGFRVADGPALARLLADAATPAKLFGKPAGEGGGAGALAIAREADGWRFEGRLLDPAAMADALGRHRAAGGLILQPRLQNHAAIRAVFGDGGLMTARMLVARTVDGAQVYGAMHKIIVGHALADKFDKPGAGNMLAGLDLATGRVTHVYMLPRHRRFLLERFTHHPDTKAAMVDFTLPMWDEALALARGTADAFPEAALLGLDVVITDDGPLLLEANTSWGVALPQLSMETGLAQVYRDLFPRLDITKREREWALRILAGEAPPEDAVGFRRTASDPGLAGLTTR